MSIRNLKGVDHKLCKKFLEQIANEGSQLTLLGSYIECIYISLIQQLCFFCDQSCTCITFAKFLVLQLIPLFIHHTFVQLSKVNVTSKSYLLIGGLVLLHRLSNYIIIGKKVLKMQSVSRFF